MNEEKYEFGASLGLHGYTMGFNYKGLFAALTRFKLDVDLDDSDWIGSVDYEYWGPQIYATIRF
jgi:hypothetical protein